MTGSGTVLATIGGRFKAYSRKHTSTRSYLKENKQKNNALHLIKSVKQKGLKKTSQNTQKGKKHTKKAKVTSESTSAVQSQVCMLGLVVLQTQRELQVYRIQPKH